MDPRIKELAHSLVHFSTKLQPKERVLIEAVGIDALPLLEALIEETYAAGAYPTARLKDSRLNRQTLLGATEESLAFEADIALAHMKGMDAYIGIGAGANAAELADVPPEKLTLHSKVFDKVLRQRVDHSKWVVLRYPNPAMAQLAGMSTRTFEDFYYQVCTLDYAKMDKAMNALVAAIEATDEVHITGPATDLTFSVKGMSAIKCAGEFNIPDGEVYTAPVKDSVQGHIAYNTPSRYQGTSFDSVVLEFKNGKIIACEGSDPEALEAIFDTDEGARYIGEFAFGVNPYITEPMNDILFDEKISGSIHFTPGAAYEDCDNGNRSAVHWDLVLMQTPEYGGGKIFFDGELVREDGRFVREDLLALNPEHLS